MEPDYQIEEMADYLLITVTRGRWEIEPMRMVVDRVAAECQARGYRRVLVDTLALAGWLRDFDRYLIGQYIAEKLQGVRVANLSRAEVINKFAENVAVNRGAWFLVTSNRELALKWLRQSGPNSPSPDRQ
jgi:hypothetical protein